MSHRDGPTCSQQPCHTGDHRVTIAPTSKVSWSSPGRLRQQQPCNATGKVECDCKKMRATDVAEKQLRRAFKRLCVCWKNSWKCCTKVSEALQHTCEIEGARVKERRILHGKQATRNVKITENDCIGWVHPLFQASLGEQSWADMSQLPT
jgi:hypothetical protein